MKTQPLKIAAAWTSFLCATALLAQATTITTLQDEYYGATNDPFQNATVASNSPVIVNSAIGNIFGATGGIESESTLFASGTVGQVSFVNFSTASPINLTSLEAIFTDDAPTNNRAVSEMRVYSTDSNFANPSLITSIPIESPYSSVYGESVIIVSTTFAAVSSQYFRAEFVAASTEGPRVMELDANTVTADQPDGTIGRKPDPTKGADIYNYSGVKQRQALALNAGQKRKIYVDFENDGDAPDAFTLRATKGNSSFKVKYFNGSTDVTAEVIAGTFNTGPIAVGEKFTLIAKVTGKSSLAGKKGNFYVRAFSTNNTRKRDAVVIKARSTGL